MRRFSKRFATWSDGRPFGIGNGAITLLADGRYACREALKGRVVSKLGQEDFSLVDQFIEVVLDRHKNGICSTSEAVGDIAHLIAAIDRADGDDHRSYMLAIIAAKDE